MFLSHLNTFLLFIALLLFLLRIKNKTFSEFILILFCIQTFISSGLWLYMNYYNSELNILIDYFGILNENIILLYCSLFIYFQNTKIHLIKQIKIVTFVVLVSLFLFFIHSNIKKESALIFYPTNLNIELNLVFQLVLDLIFFSSFLYFLNQKKSIQSKELFDGNFKKYITIGFSFYFIQDLFVLLLLLLAVKEIILPEFLMNVSVFFNLITSISLIMAAIYTNWLKEYNLIRNSRHEVIAAPESHLSITHLNQLKKIDWNEIQFHFKDSHSELILKIESNKQLSQTEKLYAFLDHFNFSNKELSNVLFVSIRTVETNFYRMRRKFTSCV